MLEALLLLSVGLTIGLLIGLFNDQKALFGLLLRQVQMQARLDLLLRQAGLEANPNAEIEEAIRIGEKIVAIRLYRELTGVSLNTAKKYIDAQMKLAKS